MAKLPNDIFPIFESANSDSQYSTCTLKFV
jgi:hypothetical protein